MKEQEVGIVTHDDELFPFYATDEAAGGDLRASISTSCFIEPGSTALIPTGVFLEIPKGYEVQIRPRSGLAFKHSVTVINTPATIDSDYCGEIKVVLINHGKETFEVKPKMRIAQAVLAEVVRAKYKLLQEISKDTARGEGGFGHTGSH